jgi:hypothetical protein
MARYSAGWTGYKLAVVMDEDDFIFLIDRSLKVAKRDGGIDRIDDSNMSEFLDILSAVVFDEIEKDHASAIVVKGSRKGECYLISSREQLIDFIKELNVLEEVGLLER